MKCKKIAASLAAAVIAISPVFSGNSGGKVLTGFSAVNSCAAEYSKDTEGFVRRMYNVVLKRDPDPKGLSEWTTQLNNHEATAADIVYGFFWSDEYKKQKKSNEQIVTDCYNAMLDRGPDPTGKADWLSRLDVGMTPLAVCDGFVGSIEFRNLCSQYGITAGRLPISFARDENYERTYFVYRLYANCLGRTPDSRDTIRGHFSIVTAKITDDLVKDSGIRHSFNLSKESHICKDINDIIRKTIDVVLEIPFDILWISFQLFKCIIACIIKTIAGCLAKKTIFYSKFLYFIIGFQHFISGW